MPAKSKKQQRFMGMVHATQKGEISAPSSAVADAAKSMSSSDAKDFASTKHKGLPEKKEALTAAATEFLKKSLGMPGISKAPEPKLPGAMAIPSPLQPSSGAAPPTIPKPPTGSSFAPKPPQAAPSAGAAGAGGGAMPGMPAGAGPIPGPSPSAAAGPPQLPSRGPATAAQPAPYKAPAPAAPPATPAQATLRPTPQQAPTIGTQTAEQRAQAVSPAAAAMQAPATPPPPTPAAAAMAAPATPPPQPSLENVPPDVMARLQQLPPEQQAAALAALQRHQSASGGAVPPQSPARPRPAAPPSPYDAAAGDTPQTMDDIKARDRMLSQEATQEIDASQSQRAQQFRQRHPTLARQGGLDGPAPGQLRLTDYGTGKPTEVDPAKKQEAVAKMNLRRQAQGRPDWKPATDAEKAQRSQAQQQQRVADRPLEYTGPDGIKRRFRDEASLARYKSQAGARQGDLAQRQSTVRDRQSGRRRFDNRYGSTEMTTLTKQAAAHKMAIYLDYLALQRPAVGPMFKLAAAFKQRKNLVEAIKQAYPALQTEQVSKLAHSLVHCLHIQLEKAAMGSIQGTSNHPSAGIGSTGGGTGAAMAPSMSSTSTMGMPKAALEGGKADGVGDSSFPSEALAAGVKVEMSEHTKDKGKAKEIAKDHLTEGTQYYEELEEMEEDLQEDKKEAGVKRAMCGTCGVKHKGPCKYKRQHKKASAGSVALLRTLGIKQSALTTALGAGLGYRGAPDTPGEKLEGGVRGAVRGAGTGLGAIAGGAAGGIGGAALANNIDARSDVLLSILSALGVGGGAALGGLGGYAGTGAIMGKPSWESDNKEAALSPAAQGVMLGGGAGALAGGAAGLLGKPEEDETRMGNAGKGLALGGMVGAGAGGATGYGLSALMDVLKSKRQQSESTRVSLPPGTSALDHMDFDEGPGLYPSPRPGPAAPPMPTQPPATGGPAAPEAGLSNLA